MSKLINRIRRALSCQYWTIAYGDADGEIDRIITEKYITLADPFLFQHRGENWLFCERQDLTDMKGNIWCINLDDPEAEPILVLDEPFHLSYPQVFTYADGIYMIPESRQAGEVRIYKCRNFPDRWEAVDVLFPFPGVDTTLYMVDTCIDRTRSRQERLAEGPNTIPREGLVFTYVDKHLEIYRIETEADRFEVRKSELVFSGEDDLTVRPAGRMIELINPENNECKLLRPAQFCKNYYGEKLLFYRFNDMQEELSSEMTPDDFDYLPLKPLGIHTYNANDDYQVIDILHEETGIGVLFKKIKWTWYNKRHSNDKRESK